jgi:hypothetical protein
MKKAAFYLFLFVISCTVRAMYPAPPSTVRTLLMQSPWQYVYNYEDTDQDGQYTKFGRDCFLWRYWPF